RLRGRRLRGRRLRRALLLGSLRRRLGGRGLLVRRWLARWLGGGRLGAGRRRLLIGGRLRLRFRTGGCLVAASRVAGSAGLTADDGEAATDRDDLVLLDEDLRDDARRGRRNLGVDLVRRDLEQRLVDLDRVALGLQ